MANEQPKKRKRPWIGLIGMVTLLIGLCAAYNDAGFIGGSLAIVGGAILAYALFAGHIKLFG